MCMSPISKTKGFILQNMSETFPYVLSKQKTKVSSLDSKLMSHLESVWNASSMAGICHQVETKTATLRSTAEIHYSLFVLRECLGQMKYQVVILSSKRWNPSHTEICAINLIHFSRVTILCQVFNIATGHTYLIFEKIWKICMYTHWTVFLEEDNFMHLL